MNETSDDIDSKLRATHFFIERKLSSLHTAGNVCMTWWVSTIVFCGTIFAAVWLQRGDLKETTYVKWLLFGVVIIFFAGLAFFGYRVIYFLNEFKKTLSKSARSLAIEAEVNRVFKTEVDFFINGMWVGTVCAALILFAWIAFGLSLWKFNCCPQARHPSVPKTSSRSLSNHHHC